MHTMQNFLALYTFFLSENLDVNLILLERV
jgi:hypothetical protein